MELWLEGPGLVPRPGEVALALDILPPLERAVVFDRGCAQRNSGLGRSVWMTLEKRDHCRPGLLTTDLDVGLHEGMGFHQHITALAHDVHNLPLEHRTAPVGVHVDELTDRVLHQDE